MQDRSDSEEEGENPIVDINSSYLFFFLATGCSYFLLIIHCVLARVPCIGPLHIILFLRATLQVRRLLLTLYG